MLSNLILLPPHKKEKRQTPVDNFFVLNFPQKEKRNPRNQGNWAKNERQSAYNRQICFFVRISRMSFRRIIQNGSFDQPWQNQQIKKRPVYDNNGQYYHFYYKCRVFFQVLALRQIKTKLGYNYYSQGQPHRLRQKFHYSGFKNGYLKILDELEKQYVGNYGASYAYGHA